MFNKKDLSSNFFLLILGLFLAFQSMRLSVWGKDGPGPGFFPLVIAIILIGLSLSIIFEYFLVIRAKDKEKISTADQREGQVSVFKVSSYLVLMLLYGISVEKVGFLISSALFLLLMVRYIEKQSWKITISVGLASIIISYLLFVSFLGVPLPKGLIK